MLKIATASLALLLTVPAMAQTPDASVTNWVQRGVDDCPGSRVTVEKTEPLTIKGWSTWRATQTSTESRCGRAMYVLTSGRNVFSGDAFQLTGSGSVEKRLAEFAKQRLRRDVQVEIGKAAAPALRPVRLIATTKQGPLTYSGWVDQDSGYLLIGRTGSLDGDPGRTLLESLGAAEGAKRGNPMGRIQIVELSDFQCPTCARAHELLEPIITKNLDRISYTRLDLPLFEHHDWVMDAALASRAVQKVAPAKYWEFVDHIFSNQSAITKANVQSMLQGFATDLDLDWKAISAAAAKPENRAALLAQTGRAFDNGIYGTPTFIINGRIVFYGNDADYLRSRLQTLLK